jgi:putative membrane protein
LRPEECRGVACTTPESEPSRAYQITARASSGDVAAYLAGARTRFGFHVLDPQLTESEFVVQRVSNGKAVRVAGATPLFDLCQCACCGMA